MILIYTFPALELPAEVPGTEVPGWTELSGVIEFPGGADLPGTEVPESIVWTVSDFRQFDLDKVERIAPARVFCLGLEAEDEAEAVADAEPEADGNAEPEAEVDAEPEADGNAEPEGEVDAGGRSDKANSSRFSTKSRKSSCVRSSW